MKDVLGECVVGVCVEVVMYVLVEVVCVVCEMVVELGVDCCIVIGGGLMIGFGKVIVFELLLLIFVVLMIYVGLEMMLIYGFIEGWLKCIGCDVCVLLWIVIYDLLLMVLLLLGILVVFGVNVMVYVVEVFYVEDVNLVISLMVEELICVFGEVLFVVVCDL